MDHYTCRLVNRDGSADDIDIGDFIDDGSAILAGRNALLVSLTAAAMEVWCDELLIVRLARDVAQFRRRNEPPRGLWRGAA